MKYQMKSKVKYFDYNDTRYGLQEIQTTRNHDFQMYKTLFTENIILSYSVIHDKELIK